MSSIIILGGGSVTTEYYLPALRHLGRLGEATVVDPDADEIARRHPAFADARFSAEGFASFLAALPAADPLACVIVALPNRFHVEAVNLALDRGRHVLCEKPLALTASACAGMAARAAAAGRLLKVAMSRRYLPTFMLARDIVRGGELGPVRAIELRDSAPFLWRPRSFDFFSRDAGGVLADMGVHYLDYLETLVGPLEPVSYGDDARGGLESSVAYELRAGGAPVHMQLSRIHQAGAWLKIMCEGGEIVIDKGDEAELTVTPRGASSRRVRLGEPFDDPAWPRNFQGSFCQMLVDFQRSVAGEATRIADAADAQRAAALIEWAYAHRPMAPARAKDATPVFVTGGTGFIGGHLVERLCADGAEVKVAVRSPGSCANVARFPVTFAPTDLLDAGSVRGALAGARRVYHLAYGASGDDQARVNIEGTKSVVEAAIAEGAEAVVVLSTMYVFGFPGEGPVDESFPYAPVGGVYGSSKATMERWCLERAKSSGRTRIVVLNPTCVFGPGGGAYTCLPVDLAASGGFCWISGGQGLCNYNYVGNLVDAVVAAAVAERAHGMRFIISDGVATWREVIEPLLAPLDVVVPDYTPEELARLPRNGGPFRLRDLMSAITSAPDVRRVAKRSAAVRAAIRIAKPLRGSAGSPAPQAGVAPAAKAGPPPEWLADLFPTARTRFSASRAQEILGWTPRRSLAEAQAETVQWLAEDGRYNGRSAR